MLAEILSSMGNMAGEALSCGSCRDKIFAGLSCELYGKEARNSAGLAGSFSAEDGNFYALLVTSSLCHS